MFLHHYKYFLELLLIVHKGVRRELVVIFSAKELLKGWSFYLEVEVVEESSHEVENGDVTHSENQFLLDTDDRLHYVFEVCQDLSVLLVFACGFWEIWQVEYWGT